MDSGFFLSFLFFWMISPRKLVSFECHTKIESVGMIDDSFGIISIIEFQTKMIEEFEFRVV